MLEAELVLQVVVAREVIEDRQSFHDGVSTLIMIDNDWDVTIRAELGKPRLLLNVGLEDVNTLVHVILAICFLQLLEQDRDLKAYETSDQERN